MDPTKAAIGHTGSIVCWVPSLLVLLTPPLYSRRQPHALTPLQEPLKNDQIYPWRQSTHQAAQLAGENAAHWTSPGVE